MSSRIIKNENVVYCLKASDREVYLLNKTVVHVVLPLTSTPQWLCIFKVSIHFMEVFLIDSWVQIKQVKHINFIWQPVLLSGELNLLLCFHHTICRSIKNFVPLDWFSQTRCQVLLIHQFFLKRVCQHLKETCSTWKQKRSDHFKNYFKFLQPVLKMKESNCQLVRCFFF